MSENMEKETTTTNQTELNLEQQLEDQKDKYLRIIADYENRMKRAKIDAVHSINIAIENMVLDFTPIIDDLSNAYTIASNETRVGLDLVIKNMKKVLIRYGIEEIVPKAGDDFDANLHQAISSKESEMEEGKITEVLKIGYKLKDKTILPAIVITSK